MATAPLAANVALKLLSSFLALIFLRTNAPARNGFGITFSDVLRGVGSGHKKRRR